MVQACAASLLEVKNAQLRFQILAEIVAADRSEVELLAGLLGRILATFDYGDKVSLICETETLFNMFVYSSPTFFRTFQSRTKSGEAKL